MVLLVLRDESSPVYGKLVVRLALVETRVLGHRGVDLELTLDVLIAQTPFTDLETKQTAVKFFTRYSCGTCWSRPPFPSSLTPTPS